MKLEKKLEGVSNLEKELFRVEDESIEKVWAKFLERLQKELDIEHTFNLKKEDIKHEIVLRKNMKPSHRLTFFTN